MPTPSKRHTNLVLTGGERDRRACHPRHNQTPEEAVLIPQHVLHGGQSDPQEEERGTGKPVTLATTKHPTRKPR